MLPSCEENPMPRTGGKFKLDVRDEDIVSTSAVRARALLREEPAGPLPETKSGAPDKFRNDVMCMLVGVQRDREAGPCRPAAGKFEVRPSLV